MKFFAKLLPVLTKSSNDNPGLIDYTIYPWDPPYLLLFVPIYLLLFFLRLFFIYKYSIEFYKGRVFRILFEILHIGFLRPVYLLLITFIISIFIDNYILPFPKFGFAYNDHYFEHWRIQFAILGTLITIQAFFLDKFLFGKVVNHKFVRLARFMLILLSTFFWFDFTINFTPYMYQPGFRID